MPNQSPIAKKTKSEILDEYSALLEKYEELKMISKTLNEPQNLELLNKTKEHTFDKIKSAADNLKNEINESLTEISEKQIAEVQKLNEIQKAIEISKKNLELNYGIQVAADTLQNLIQENQKKKTELEDEIKQARKNWEREQEEYKYNIERNRKREEESYQEAKSKKEKELSEKETQITNREEEFDGMKKKIESFPIQLEAALKQKEKETIQKLNGEFENEKLILKKDWVAEKNILEIKVKNLEELVGKQEGELSLLRKETENANEKAQQLAVKVIESGANSKNQPKQEQQQSL